MRAEIKNDDGLGVHSSVWQGAGQRVKNCERDEVSALLVVVPRLERVDMTSGNAINETIFLRDSPTPTSGQVEAQRFRLSNAIERIRQHRFDEFECARRRFAVGVDPITQIC